MFVTTESWGDSRRNERSDSSASTTSHSPAPQAALRPVVRSSPPMRYDGSSPIRSRACAAIELVVVLPCVPAMASVRFSALTSASSSLRCSSRSPRAAAAARSGLSAAMAVDTTTSTSSPAGMFSAAWPMTGTIPSSRSGSR